MIQLSVVVITLNEEKNLERCLRSVLAIADEMVVVDSYSTDRTAEIARSLGAKVVLHAFEGHIEQKNFAITQAGFRHVLSLDADEWLDEDAIKSIREIKQNWDADGYVFNRLNNYCGKWIRHGAWFPDRKLRLWDSAKGKWKGLNPHDEFVMNPGSSVKPVKGSILHQSYRTVEEHEQKTMYFSGLASKAYFRSGKRSGWLNLLFSPAFRFIRDYFFKLGFLDGVFGFHIARLTAREVYLKYAQLRQLQRDRPGSTHGQTK